MKYTDNKTGKLMKGAKKRSGKKKKKKPMRKYPSSEISNKNVMAGRRKRKKTAKGKSYQIPSLSQTKPKRLGQGGSVKRLA